jgi:hypothetical protein
MRRPHITWCERPMPWHKVPRPFMPQIDDEDHPALLEFLKVKGVPHKQVWLDPGDLHFDQKVSMDLVHEMPPNVYAQPIWVSNEPTVLDGNHRATAHRERGDTVEAVQIDLPFEKAIEVLFSFNGTYDYAELDRRLKANAARIDANMPWRHP